MGGFFFYIHPMKFSIITHQLAKREASFYENLGFNSTTIDNMASWAADGCIIECYDNPSIRAGIRLFTDRSTIDQLKTQYKMVDTPIGSLVTAPSGTWIYLTDTDQETKEMATSILGKNFGISLESTDMEASIAFWLSLGFEITMGGPDQGWVALMKDVVGVSIMSPMNCPHFFANPSLTYFNGKKNPDIIASISERGVPIKEEVTVFNENNEVDNVILQDAGGVGFFIFNDEI